jgi:myo-inositol-1-phosphate synthase
MQYPDSSPRRLGVATVGLGGAVATTAVAGTQLIRAGHAGLDGLPLADLDDALTRPLAAYDDLVFRGWDFCPDDLATATREHDVLSLEQYEAVSDPLADITPWRAVSDERFCQGVSGTHHLAAESLEAAVEAIRADLRQFRGREHLDGTVMLNVASTERTADLDAPALQNAEAFERGLSENDEAISPAMCYAWAAIEEGVPYVNFTPSPAAEVPALAEHAAAEGVPVTGKDGKTGQTFLKTVVAPGLRDRALQVDGWFSTNILGNRDGVALKDSGSLDSKLGTKGSVLDQILGYRVEDHVVDISYYRPRGDNKEAWDNVDLIGFLGQKMQLKINFLCRDSILAAPLAIELARLIDFAQREGDGGVQDQLGVFFKSPMTTDGADPEHALPEQQRALLSWLKSRASAENGATENGAAAVATNGAPATEA